jgi:hypothetical protein
VRMPRAFNASAIARTVVVPLACNARTTGSTFAAAAPVGCCAPLRFAQMVGPLPRPIKFMTRTTTKMMIKT